MIARRSFLAVIGGGLVAASLPAIAQAGAMPAGTAAPEGIASGPVREVSGLRRALGATPAAGEPREMQYYIVRRRYYVRRYYYRPRRYVRCWWNGYARVCRYW